MDHALLVKRLFYLSTHRGCKETDFILGRFATKHLAQMDSQTCDIYEKFLHENDWDIYAWLTDTRPLPPQYQHPFIDLIKQSLHP